MFANVMDKLRIIGELRSSNCDCDWLLHVTPVHQSHATCTPVVFKFLRQLTNRLSFSVPGWTKWGEGDWNFDWHGLQSLVGYEKIDVSMVYLVCWGSLWYYGSLIMTYLQIPWFLLVHVPFLVTAIPTDLLLQEPFEWFWKYPHECVYIPCIARISYDILDDILDVHGGNWCVLQESWVSTTGVVGPFSMATLRAAESESREEVTWLWKFHYNDEEFSIYLGMDQYLLIPFLGGWTFIYQLFWCLPGVQGFDTLPNGFSDCC